MKNNWLDSVFSDGTKAFLSPAEPVIGDTITIRIRLLEKSPVTNVMLRYILDGDIAIKEMALEKVENHLAYYKTEITMTQQLLSYQFMLVSHNTIYYKNQKGIFTTQQNAIYNYKVRADYSQPAWVKDAVFYQIFPERFANGRPELSVKTGEYKDGEYEAIGVSDWNQRPTHWDESHCLDFYGGDLYGIIDKIPYLKDLGVTALYLNPIFQAPSVHKYDCVDFEAVDEHLGGDEALAALSKALHAEGMKLILDISINHTGTSHKWFKAAKENPDATERNYYIFYEDGSCHLWKGTPNLATLNFRNDVLKEKLYKGQNSVIKKWLKPPYSIDGWRFDVADVMAKYGQEHLDHEVWPEIRESIREVNPQAYILAECWDDSAEYLQGNEWDSAMNYYSCARMWRQFLGEGDLYLGSSPLLRKVKYQMTAQEVKERLFSYLGQMPYAMWENQFNLIDSHDVGRLHNFPGMNFDKVKTAAIGQFTQVGAPSLYYGDEAAAEGWIETVEGCRFPMPWDSGFQEGEAYRLYKTLCYLRRNHEALSKGSFQFVYAEGHTLAFARYNQEEIFLPVLSAEEEDATIKIPLGILGVSSKAEVTELLGSKPQFAVLDEEGLGVLEIVIPKGKSFLLKVEER